MVINLMRGIIFILLLLSSTALSAYQQAGEKLSISGHIDDDIYLAGGQIDLYATVEGDAVVAGGQLNLEGEVKADVIAAGGDVRLRGKVADDARLTGGNVRVLATIGDDLVVAGGRVQTGPMATVGGNAWINAGDIVIEGRVAQNLRANGGSVVLIGTVDGDVELWAERIEISRSAVISGKLNYRSSRPAMIADGAIIQGKVTHTPVEIPVGHIATVALFAGLVLLLAFLLAGIVLYLLFPGVAEACSNTIRRKPWISLGFGLAVFAGGPVIIVLLFSTGIGFLLALLLLATYLLILLSGYFAGAYFVAETGLRKLNKINAATLVRVVSLGLTMILLTFINIIPLLGSLINWLVMLAGIGALKQQLVTAYIAKH